MTDFWSRATPVWQAGCQREANRTLGSLNQMPDGTGVSAGQGYALSVMQSGFGPHRGRDSAGWAQQRWSICNGAGTSANAAQTSDCRNPRRRREKLKEP
jgi:hypothetical protein